MPRITDAFLVQHPQDRVRPAGVTPTQPQTFQAVSFPILLELHLVCSVRATRAEFRNTYPITLEVTDADGFPVQAPVPTILLPDGEGPPSVEGVESRTLYCPYHRLILHSVGTYRIVLHLPDAPAFVLLFEMSGPHTKSPYEPAHDTNLVSTAM